MDQTRPAAPSESPTTPTGQDWFSVVEIEVNARCNRRCSYCPVSLRPIPSTPRLMSDTIFHRLIDALVAIDYAGKVSFHFLNEPLLRRDLAQLVATVRTKLPKAYQLLYTNGDLLTDERYRSLVASGIDHFLVTRHDHTSLPERPQQTVQYPEDLLMSNRGGVMSEVSSLSKPMELPCYAPSEMLIVTTSGDVLLCCDDSNRELVMGNIGQQSLESIWFSRRFSQIRMRLRRGHRGRASKICKVCSNREYIRPHANDFRL